jgi:hypothetical protein
VVGATVREERGAGHARWSGLEVHVLTDSNSRGCWSTSTRVIYTRGQVLLARSVPYYKWTHAVRPFYRWNDPPPRGGGVPLTVHCTRSTTHCHTYGESETSCLSLSVGGK